MPSTIELSSPVQLTALPAPRGRRPLSTGEPFPAEIPLLQVRRPLRAKVARPGLGGPVPAPDNIGTLEHADTGTYLQGHIGGSTGSLGIGPEGGFHDVRPAVLVRVRKVPPHAVLLASVIHHGIAELRAQPGFIRDKGKAEGLHRVETGMTEIPPGEKMLTPAQLYRCSKYMTWTPETTLN